jgi:hypothetical protein
MWGFRTKGKTPSDYAVDEAICAVTFGGCTAPLERQVQIPDLPRLTEALKQHLNHTDVASKMPLPLIWASTFRRTPVEDDMLP